MGFVHRLNEAVTYISNLLTKMPAAPDSWNGAGNWDWRSGGDHGHRSQMGHGGPRQRVHPELWLPAFDHRSYPGDEGQHIELTGEVTRIDEEGGRATVDLGPLVTVDIDKQAGREVPAAEAQEAAA